MPQPGNYRSNAVPARRRPHTVQSFAARRVGGALALGMVAALLISGCGDSGGAPANSAEAAPEPQAEAAPTATAPTEAEDAEVEPPTQSEPEEEAPSAAAPVQLRIPSIEVDESLIDLGIASDGTLEVPTDYDDVGWFTGGGMPGGRGPTVLAGHVDSLTGPAVFYRLPELGVGDEVEVLDENGRTHVYEVTRTDVFPKDDFPTREVFGQVPGDELRLITCTGDFDTTEQSYVDNHIVFAAPVEGG